MSARALSLAFLFIASAAMAQPTASTPVSWDEVAACKRAEDLVFTADDVIERVGESGDLFAVTLPG